MSNIKLPSVGSWYESRSDLYDALLHGHMQKGIQKDKRTGLVGIVLSSLYEGDHDEGDHIIYTGEGGKKKTETQLSSNQELTKGNLLLSKCHEKGIPVHVTRGWTSKSIYAPDSGYRYDGVYTITDVKEERSSRGFRMYRFHMKRIKSQGNIPTNPDNLKLSVSMKRSRNKKATTKKIC